MSSIILPFGISNYPQIGTGSTEQAHHSDHLLGQPQRSIFHPTDSVPDFEQQSCDRYGWATSTSVQSAFFCLEVTSSITTGVPGIAFAYIPPHGFDVRVITSRS